MVTGGAGFIGSAVCRLLVAEGCTVVNLDRRADADSLASLRSIAAHPAYHFVCADIADRSKVAEALLRYRVNAVMHLAAESCVDRSIESPEHFIQTNIVGTYSLLETCLDYWRGLTVADCSLFRFHHVSTDEVFGDLPFDSSRFSEASPYAPSSPYSASKAASDHLVRAWYRTFDLPVVLSNCSNNYGPHQRPERLIPLVILNAVNERPLPLYGTGRNVRDWLHVEDHARALFAILTRGRIGESYVVGGDAERANLAVVEAICDELDRQRPRPDRSSRRDLIRFVADRPGHDRRYAIDTSKLRLELHWRPRYSFESGLTETIRWYLDGDSGAGTLSANR